ncbi:MAG: V-type ATP synthase subunit I [Tissierellia bacterium]|nr:V-type ATP synthase subunit I [Tissierellia bacterium]
MAIVKMDKFNLLSFEENRESLLRKLQEFNYVHFKDLKVDEDENYITEVKESKNLAKIEKELSKCEFAIDLLERYEDDKSSIESMKEEIKCYLLNELNQKALNFKFDQTFRELKDLDDYRNVDVQKLQKNQNIIDELEPWKDLSVDVDDIYKLKTVFVETGSIANRYFDDLMKAFDKRSFKHSLIEKVSTKGDTTYMIALSDESESEEFSNFLRENGFSKVKIRADKNVSNRLNELQKDKSKIEEEIKGIDKKLKNAVKYLQDFRVYEAYLKNLKRKEKSSENFLKTSSVDYIEGYIPSDMKSEFRKDLDEVLGSDYVLDLKEADRDDPDVPIKLKNGRFTTPFETVTEMYSLPRYNEIDPTPLFAPFYALFTGFMVGDIGYGLVLVIAILIGLKKFNLDKGMQKSMRMFLRVGISATIWGIIFGSFFGGVIELPSLVNPQEDYMQLIVISLVIGVFAMFFALGIKGYMHIRDGHVKDAIFDVVFWYLAVGGAIAALLAKMEIIPNSLMKIMLILMAIGMVGIVATGGRAEKSVGGKIGWGVYELYGITSWVGELVSFLRLMALVLSSGFVAYAINMICQMLVQGGPIGIVFSIIVFLLFQGFNMFLAYLSAYVHSARLIFVEMFNKFYEGGGFAFKEMTEDTKFINITRGGK